MHISTLTICALAAGVATTMHAQQPAIPGPVAAAAAPKPIIGILSPTNNATVTSPVTVRFRLVNYGVAPAGTQVERTGHFHVLIDDVAGAAGTIIPADSMHVHYGKGQIEVSLPVPPGRHTLRAVLGDYLHKVIGPELVSAPVTVNVIARRKV